MGRPVPRRGAAGTARWLRQAWRRYRGQVAGGTVLAALALGVVGYGEQNPHLSVVDRCYAAIQLFSMGGDGVNKPPIPIPLQIARWLAPLTVAYAVLRTLSTIFLHQWTQARIRVFFRRHVIICGLGAAGLQFAIGFHDRGDRVVVIDHAPSPAAAEKCRELGIPVLVGNATEQTVLALAGVRRARYLVAVCGQDTVNAEVALAVTVAAAHRRSPISCLVQLADERLCRLVDQQALTATDIGAVAYEFFNIYQAGPAALFDTHAALLTPQGGSPPHLMILGAGRFATALVLEAARRWRLDHTHPAGRIRITLLAPDADAQAATLEAHHPVLATTCELTTCPIDPSDPDGLTPPPPEGGSGGHPTAAVICLGEDGASLRAMFLSRQVLPEQCPVIVCIIGRPSVADLLNRFASGMLAAVEGFSLRERVCRPELLLNGPRETLAQAIHADYARRRREQGANPDDPALAVWETLSEALRASNRAQAVDLANNLRTVGCDLVPTTEWDSPPSPFTEAEVEHLAALEHRRWEAERHQDGWRLGPTRDLDRKLSPYLVPWEDLAEEIKDLDRDAIRALPTFLARAGFAIVRRTPPARSTDTTP
ncbi:MAG: NAD-binding protein [Pseudonocardiales bacterium]|nr:NAD-binding protein [Pseudonocardiales bacterium]